MEQRGGQEAFEAKTVAKLTSFGLLVAAYISLNSSLNLLNKWSLGIYGFKFPFMLTACHMAFSFLALAPVALRTPWDVHRRTLEKQWQGVVCIGAFMAFNIVLNNASLVGISLTLNQIIRCDWARPGADVLSPCAHACHLGAGLRRPGPARL